MSGFAATQWLVPLEIEGQSVRETLSKVIPSDLRELPTNNSTVFSLVSRNTPCIGILTPDRNALQVSFLLGSQFLVLLDHVWVGIMSILFRYSTRLLCKMRLLKSDCPNMHLPFTTLIQCCFQSQISWKSWQLSIFQRQCGK